MGCNWTSDKKQKKKISFKTGFIWQTLIEMISVSLKMRWILCGWLLKFFNEIEMLFRLRAFWTIFILNSDLLTTWTTWKKYSSNFMKRFDGRGLWEKFKALKSVSALRLKPKSTVRRPRWCFFSVWTDRTWENFCKYWPKYRKRGQV